MPKFYKQLTWRSLRTYYGSAITPLVQKPLDKFARERFLIFTSQMLHHGFCEADLWSLDDTITDFVLPRLKRFRRWFGGRSIPGTMTQKDWCHDLDRMIKAFELMRTWEWPFHPDKARKVKQGLALFHKHYHSLWD